MALSSSSSSAMPTMFTIFAWKLNTNFMKVMIQLTCNQVGYGVLHGIWFWVEIASLQGIWKKNIKSIPVFELSCRQILDGKFKVMTSTPFLWEQLLTIDNCLRLVWDFNGTHVQSATCFTGSLFWTTTEFGLFVWYGFVSIVFTVTIVLKNLNIF